MAEPSTLTPSAGCTALSAGIPRKPSMAVLPLMSKPLTFNFNADGRALTSFTYFLPLFESVTTLAATLFSNPYGTLSIEATYLSPPFTEKSF